MDQVTNGIHSVLSFASVYNGFQRLLGADQAKTRFVNEFVKPYAGAKILDIGCGTGSILQYLPSDVTYTGFDLNPNYIAHARKQYEGRGTFVCERVSDASMKEAGEYDIVLAIAILHHLSDAEADSLFVMANKSLKRRGRLVTFDNVYVENQSPIARYIISRDRGKHVRTLEGYQALASASFADVQVRILHDMLRIPYTHLIMSCQKG